MSSLCTEFVNGLIGIKLDKGRCCIRVELHADLTIKPIKNQIHNFIMHKIINKRAHKIIVLLYNYSEQAK